MNSFETRKSNTRLEKITSPDDDGEKEHDVKRFENSENSEITEAFVKSQEAFIRESEGVIESMQLLGEGVGKTNTTLLESVGRIPGDQGDVLRNEVQSAQKRLLQVWNRYSGDVAAFVKVAVLANAPLFLAGHDVVSETEKSTMKYEQVDKKQETFEEMVVRAKKELAENGITSEQKNAYIPLVSKALQRGIEPIVDFSKSDIGNMADKAIEFVPNLVRGKKYDASVYESQMKEMMQSEDAFALYLGLPQKHETFGISDYHPSVSKEKRCYFKLNGYFGNSPEERKGRIYELLFSIDMNSSPENPSRAPFFENHTLTHHTISKGEDERGHYISYYDRWDFEYPMEGKQGFFGKPFEIYDRIYYDPKTFEPIEVGSKKD